MWEKREDKKPVDDGYRLVVAGDTIGCMMCRWNGARWCSEPYLGADDHWTSDTISVYAWLRTPLDDENENT